MSLTVLVIGFIGLLVGGIINLLADDLPHYRLPRLPRYPDGTPRPSSAWLGITAFLLGKRVSPDGARLSWRYPLAEIATALLFMAAMLARPNDPSMSDLQRLFWLIYMAVFVLITVIDIEHKLILFSVIIPSCALAILDAVLTPAQREPNLGRALLGGGFAFGVFFVLYLGGFLYVYVTNRLQGRNITEVAFGYGDVMMATLSGLILGLESVIFAIFIAVFLGALGAFVYIVGRTLAGNKYSLFTALPYGPYIVAGTLIMLLFGAEVRMLMVGF